MFRFLKRAPTSEERHDPTRLALLRILEVNKEMAGAARPEALPDRILDAAIELVGAERGFLIQKSPPPGPEAVEGGGGARVEPERSGPRWDVVAARNIDQENVRRALKKVSRSITSQVLEKGEAFRSADAVNDETLMPAASVAELKLRSVLCVPMRLGRLGQAAAGSSTAEEEVILGCLYVDNRFAHGQFEEEAQEILEAFADQAALALERVQLLADNERVRGSLEDANRQLEFALADQVRAMDSLRAGIQPPVAELRFEYPALIGRGRAMATMLSMLDRVVDGDFPVLLCGESGTGKELVARALHANGPRSEGRFVGVNCGAIAESLLESELFGVVKGAYTGAVRDRAGLVEAAQGGVLFLDEVGEMSLALQAKLLRVIQEKRVRRVGGNEEISVDVRFVSATHRDLEREVAADRFREDLFYRLKVVQIEVPPLREHREDIPDLVQHFLERAGTRAESEPPTITDGCLERLVEHDWPGNIRELENEITRMVALGGKSLGLDLVGHLTHSPRTVSGDVQTLVGRRMADVEAQLIRATLDATGGRRGEAARMLGIPRRTFYNRLKALGIE